jgi:3-phenylpropionate/trans-cinnamate dioxygenase ferredoxin reductase subunit
MTPPIPVDREPVVIVGGGAAAASAARGLRTAGFDGRVAMIGAEDTPPYERPPLSKGFLRHDVEPEKFRILPDQWYAENDIELELGTAVAELDLTGRRVILADGKRRRYSRLVLATGGTPRRLDLGISDERVFYLRSLVDAERLREQVKPGRHVVVIGAGFIGGEVAASCRAIGAEVTMIDVLAEPLLPVCGPRIGSAVRRLHESHGVRVLTSTSVIRAQETIEGVTLQLSTREVVECDSVVVGIGLVPSIRLAAQAGLECGNGIHVDSWSRTNDERVFAVGDVAGHQHPLFGRRMRVEHHDNALKQGTAVGAVIAGQGLPYDDPHWFWSDQYEHRIQGVGVFSGEPVVRGSVEDGRFTAFWTDNGRVIGAFGIDSGTDVRRATKLISQRSAVSVDALIDSGTDLRALAAAGR